MSIGNLSSAPDQAGLRSEHDAPMDLMDLHLSFPDGLAHDAASLEVGHRAIDSTELVAQSDSDDEDSGGAASTIVGLLPLLLIVVAVYFLLLRPRQRQMRQQQELQSSLEVGDEVMLTSGCLRVHHRIRAGQRRRVGGDRRRRPDPGQPSGDLRQGRRHRGGCAGGRVERGCRPA